MVERVRILKSGSYRGYHYKKGEIYKVKKVTFPYITLDVDNGGQSVIVYISENTEFGREAEFIAENLIYELW